MKKNFTPHLLQNKKKNIFLTLFKKGAGFTLVELLVIVGILILLIAISLPVLRFSQQESDLNNSAEKVINTLRLAQSKTLASEGASQWGVYFSTSTAPHQYTLFQGINYLSRATSSDETYKLPGSVEIFDINLAGGQEVIFDRLIGSTSQSGKVSLKLETDPTKSRTIYIGNSGQVGLTIPLVPSDEERIKDSRHLHFDYSRQIDTSTTSEKLFLTFEGGISQEIIISENLKDNQIYWEGEVNVAGQIQKLKIHTHRLNDLVLGSQFSIHRDRRYNNKALIITISGDSSGSLVEYSADGLNTTSTSIYVSNLQWQ